MWLAHVSILLFLALWSLVPLALAAKPLTINTPLTSPVVCNSIIITWSGGVSPYTLTVHDDSNPKNGFPVLKDLGIQRGNLFNWTVNVAPGQVLLRLIDKNATIAETNRFGIVSGPDYSCGVQVATTLAGGVSTTFTSTVAPSATSKGSKQGTGTSTSNAGKKSKPPVAAIVGGVLGGLALIGVIVLAILFFRRKGVASGPRLAVLEDAEHQDKRLYPGMAPVPFNTSDSSSQAPAQKFPGASKEKTRFITNEPPAPTYPRKPPLNSSSASSTPGPIFSSPHDSTGAQNLDNVSVDVLVRNLAARGVAVQGDASPPAYNTS
ncbi:hypothetical protein DL96DRAFT_1627276 [Flagelloscypha sp. PMI_526]|nr:hypothetical protein DL96DRAFT_1627276 [Flagelloscypha sp. PMI_526]